MPAVTWIAAVAQIAPTVPIMMQTPRPAVVRIVPETMVVARTAMILLSVVTARLLSMLKYQITRSDPYSAGGFATRPFHGPREVLDRSALEPTTVNTSHDPELKAPS